MDMAEDKLEGRPIRIYAYYSGGKKFITKCLYVFILLMNT